MRYNEMYNLVIEVRITNQYKIVCYQQNMHMNWSLDVNFKTRIRPTALSAIVESHERTVTAIQWIHPMTKVSEYFNLYKCIIILVVVY